MVARLADIDGADISIIIPVLNECARLKSCLSELNSHPYLSAAEIIVSDGGSSDDTIGVIEKFGCLLIQSKKGRARQMNAGGQIASRSMLLFLHVDTQLPKTFTLSNNRSGDVNIWGFCPVRLSGKGVVFRCIERLMNWRSRLSAIGTGDQTLYFQHNFFNRLGGFPDIPIMEDVAICKLARKQSSPTIINTAVTTSSRRWETNGITKTILTMWGLRLAYWLGVSPHKLHRLYYPDL